MVLKGAVAGSQNFFNQKMRAEKRSVLLLLDNVGCHPPQMLHWKKLEVDLTKMGHLSCRILANTTTHFYHSID